MFPPGDTTRLLVTLIIKHIYDNGSKLNFLSTCKFIYNIADIYYYQKVKIDTEQKIKKEFTNVSLEYSTFPDIIFLNSESFDNILCLTLNSIRIAEQKSTIKIKTLPNKLKILNVSHGFTINVMLPSTLEVFSYSGPSGFPFCTLKNLKKLTILSELILNLPPNLTYLKLLSVIRPGMISCINKISTLRTLIFYDYYYFNPYHASMYIENFNIGLKHLSLSSPFEDFSSDQLKQIISKNITHFEICTPEHMNMLKEYPLLNKLTLTQINLFNNSDLEKIPSSVTTICSDWRNIKCLLQTNAIPNNVCSIIIRGQYYHIPPDLFSKNIIKLKIGELMNHILPETIEELYINNVWCDEPIIKLSPNVKKLNIRYGDRHRFIPSENCIIVYRY